MSEVFSRILLPIDFTPDTEIAVKRAIELIEPTGSSIHLIHIVNPFRIVVSNPYDARFLFSLQRSNFYRQHKMKLEQWKQTLAETLDKTTVTAEMIISQSVEDVIVRRSKNIKPDLVIIGKHSFNSGLGIMNTVSPARIVSNSGCTVLTVKPSKFYSRNQIVVIPIGLCVPQRTIGAVASLSRKLHFVVYLVAIPESISKPTNSSGQALLETFRILKRTPNCQVECRMINDTRLTKAARRFAASIQADMLLIHPEMQKTNSIIDKQPQGGINPLSGLRVLAGKPYEHNN
jgi:nucleotide-binding universal stress UspA family protein